MRIEPFQFDKLRDFGKKEAEIVIEALQAEEIIEEPEEQAPPPPPTYSEEELEQARRAGRERGYEEGIQAGRTQMENEALEREKNITALMAQTSNACEAMAQQYRTLYDQQCTIMADYVRVIARKVAGDLLDAKPEGMIRQTIERSLPLLIEQPKLNFYVQPDMVDTIHKRLLPDLKQRGLEADIDVLGDAAIASASDIRIEWKQGHVQRQTAEILTAIEQVLTQVDFAQALREAPQPEPAPAAPRAPIELTDNEPEAQETPAIEATPEPEPEPEPQPEPEAATEEEQPTSTATSEMQVKSDSNEEGIEIMNANEGDTLLSVGEIDTIIEPIESDDDEAEETEPKETLMKPRTTKE